jgi:hypothetical protein
MKGTSQDLLEDRSRDNKGEHIVRDLAPRCSGKPGGSYLGRLVCVGGWLRTATTASPKSAYRCGIGDLLVILEKDLLPDDLSYKESLRVLAHKVLQSKYHSNTQPQEPNKQNALLDKRLPFSPRETEQDQSLPLMAYWGGTLPKGSHTATSLHGLEAQGKAYQDAG